MAAETNRKSSASKADSGKASMSSIASFNVAQDNDDEDDWDDIVSSTRCNRFNISCLFMFSPLLPHTIQWKRFWNLTSFEIFNIKLRHSESKNVSTRTLVFLKFVKSWGKDQSKKLPRCFLDHLWKQKMNSTLFHRKQLLNSLLKISTFLNYKKYAITYLFLKESFILWLS